jgi:hypothetical protein
MDALFNIGVFFAGLGILLISFGIFWRVSLIEKKEKEAKKTE